MTWMNRRSNINITQIFVDAICLALTYVIAIILTGSIFRQVTLTEYLWIPVLFTMVYLFTMFTCEMYHRSTFTYQDRTLKYMVKACVLGAVFCLVMIPFTTNNELALNFLMLYILAAIVIIAVQYLTVQEFRLFYSGRFIKRALFIGYRENIQEYLYYIKKTSYQVDVVGYIPLDDCQTLEGKNLGELKDLDTILKDHIIDEVIFAVPLSRLEEMRQHVLMCKDRGLTVRLTVDFFEDSKERGAVYKVGTIPVFTYHNACLTDLQNFIKRFMDILGSVIGLLTTIPIAIITVPLIRLGGKAPFHKRTYLSINGRPFTLYCFNTISVNSYVGILDKFLIRTGIKNLPMFWNVLRGDMSLVGSIPVSASDNIFVTNDQFRTTNIKPGLTGLWRFADKKMLTDENYISNLNDAYLHKWSLIRDIWLILKTMAVILLIPSPKDRTSLFSCMQEDQEYGVGYLVSR